MSLFHNLVCSNEGMWWYGVKSASLYTPRHLLSKEHAQGRDKSPGLGSDRPGQAYCFSDRLIFCLRVFLASKFDPVYWLCDLEASYLTFSGIHFPYLYHDYNNTYFTSSSSEIKALLLFYLCLFFIFLKKYFKFFKTFYCFIFPPYFILFFLRPTLMYILWEYLFTYLFLNFTFWPFSPIFLTPYTPPLASTNMFFVSMYFFFLSFLFKIPHTV